MFQPLMLIEITTKGFVAEPVLWQTSTFWPAVDDLPLGAWLACVDDCVELEWLTLDWVELGCECFTVECPFAFECVVAFVPDVDFECFVCPEAFAELPCTDCVCCVPCFFSWPGAFPEFPGEEPWPFPATALPLNAIAATATAITPPRAFLGRCIASPDVVDKAWRGVCLPPYVLHGWRRL